jgi:hypothetical protein
MWIRLQLLSTFQAQVVVHAMSDGTAAEDLSRTPTQVLADLCNGAAQLEQFRDSRCSALSRLNLHRRAVYSCDSHVIRRCVRRQAAAIHPVRCGLPRHAAR